LDISNPALSLDRLAGPPLDLAVAAAHAMGIRAITFSGNPKPWRPGQPALSFLWGDLDAASQAATRQVRAAFARAVIHAPFYDTPIVSPNHYIEAEAQHQIGQAIRAAGELDLEMVTIHAPLSVRGMPHDEFRARLVEALCRLGDAAAAAGTRIGLENWPYPCDPAELAWLLEEADHPAVGATLDVGHIAYWFQNEGVSALVDDAAIAEYQHRVMAFIERLGPRILHLHVHDVCAADLKDHRTVGSGIIDFPPILTALSDAGFDGLLLLELGEPDFPAAAQASVQALLAAMPAQEGQRE